MAEMTFFASCVGRGGNHRREHIKTPSKANKLPGRTHQPLLLHKPEGRTHQKRLINPRLGQVYTEKLDLHVTSGVEQDNNRDIAKTLA